MQANFYTKSKFFLKQPKKDLVLSPKARIFFQFLAKKTWQKGVNVSIFGKKGKKVILNAKKVKKVIFAKKVKKICFYFFTFFS